MRKKTQRKTLSRASRRNYQDIHFWVDPTSLIKEKERILEIKVVPEEYHLVKGKVEMIVAAAMKKRI